MWEVLRLCQKGVCNQLLFCEIFSKMRDLNQNPNSGSKGHESGSKSSDVTGERSWTETGDTHIPLVSWNVPLKCVFITRFFKNWADRDANGSLGHWSVPLQTWYMRDYHVTFSTLLVRVVFLNHEFYCIILWLKILPLSGILKPKALVVGNGVRNGGKKFMNHIEFSCRMVCLCFWRLRNTGQLDKM